MEFVWFAKSSGAGFSLWGLVATRTIVLGLTPHRLKPAPRKPFVALPAKEFLFTEKFLHLRRG
jgi:hypothetical protein